jgi:hypothetical protein
MDHCINITLLVDNDAFGVTYDDQAQEVGRILRNLADRLEADSRYLDPRYGQYPTLNDSNGTRVKLIAAEPVPGSGVPGTLLADDRVATADGALARLALQSIDGAPVGYRVCWQVRVGSIDRQLCSVHDVPGSTASMVDSDGGRVTTEREITADELA